MENAFIREVYDSLQGDMADGFAIRDIENLFKPGAKLGNPEISDT